MSHMFSFFLNDIVLKRQEGVRHLDTVPDREVGEHAGRRAVGTGEDYEIIDSEEL